MTWIYIDNLKGNVPAVLCQSLATLMHKKCYNDMGAAMVKYKNNELNLNDNALDIIFKENELIYTSW